MTNRERFLEWYKQEFGDSEQARRARPLVWAGWQAACPEGWKCVPVEATDKMEEAGLDAYTPFGDMRLAIQAAIAYAPKPEDAR